MPILWQAGNVVLLRREAFSLDRNTQTLGVGFQEQDALTSDHIDFWRARLKPANLAEAGAFLYAISYLIGIYGRGPMKFPG